MSHSSPPGRRGFTLGEFLWAVLLLGAMVWVILGTKGREMDQTRIQQARDTLVHLAAMLEMESADRAPSTWPFPLLGPGTPPAGLEPAPQARIKDLFPELWVPPDPWGHAFLLRRYPTPQGVRAALACAGPEGRFPEPGDENSLQVSFPFRKN
ncbi:MAG: type II secretion system protein [Planctomycetota bacterium]